MQKISTNDLNHGVVEDRFFLVVMFGMALMLGIEVGGLQYILLKLAQDFGLSQASMGSLISLNFAATAISPLLAGPLSDRVGKKPIALVFALVYVASGLLSLLAPTVPIIAIGIAGFGTGFGGIETVCQAALADRYPRDSAQKLVLFQGILSAGCVLSPLLLQFLMVQAGCSWRVHFVICIIGFGAGFLLLTMTRFLVVVACPEGVAIPARGSGLRQLLDLVMICVLIGTFVYMFEENAVSYFMDAFYTNELHRPELSAVSLSVFWAAMALSRIFTSYLHPWRQRIIALCFLLSAAMAFAVCSVDVPAFAIVMFGVSGACYGPIWPFLLSIATDRNPGNTGLVTSIVGAVSSAGGAASPVIVGMISDTAGQRTAFFMIGLVFMAGWGSVWVMRRMQDGAQQMVDRQEKIL